MVRAIVRLTSTPLPRPAVRALILVAVIVVAASAWFGFLPFAAEPGGPVVVAAPSASPLSSASASPSAGSPDATASPTVAPAATSRPTATPLSGSLPTSRPAASPSQVPTRPAIELPETAPPSGTPATLRALSLRLDSLRATYGLPGVSAAILFADGSSWEGTSGLADVDAGRAVTPDTEFAVASISKTFLAALILVLADEDQIDLEAPVTTYLPDLAIDPAITVHQLLDHTSGLHDYFYDPDIDKALLADRTRAWTAQDALAYVGKPYFKPGKGWHYSNTNYVVLGMLAEAVGRLRSPNSCTRDSSRRSGWITPITRASTIPWGPWRARIASTAPSSASRRSPSPTGPTSSPSPRSSPRRAAPVPSPRPPRISRPGRRPSTAAMSCRPRRWRR